MLRRLCVLSGMLMIALTGTSAQAPSPRDVKLISKP